MSIFLFYAGPSPLWVFFYWVFLLTLDRFNKKKDLFAFSFFAKTAGQGLDMKQTAVYKIICCSFILKSIEKHKLFQDEIELEIQDMFGDKLEN